MEHRTAADAINGNAINQIGFPVRLSGVYGSHEEAQGVRLNGGKSESSGINADRARLLHWQECYGALWELKLSFERKHNR